MFEETDSPVGEVVVEVWLVSVAGDLASVLPEPVATGAAGRSVPEMVDEVDVQAPSASNTIRARESIVVFIEFMIAPYLATGGGGTNVAAGSTVGMLYTSGYAGATPCLTAHKYQLSTTVPVNKIPIPPVSGTNTANHQAQR